MLVRRITSALVAHAVLRKFLPLIAMALLTIRNSGYGLYPSTLGGIVPCFTSPEVAFRPPTGTATASVSIISNQLFALPYPVVAGAGSAGLAMGAKAGIGAGVGLVAVLVGTFILMFAARRRKAKQAEQEEQKVQEEEEAAPGPTELPEETTALPVEVPAAEIHEMAGGDSSEGRRWRSPLALDGEKTGSAVHLEMPGDTQLHEHHPAFKSSSFKEDLSDGESSQQASAKERSPVSPQQNGQAPEPLSPVSAPVTPKAPATIPGSPLAGMETPVSEGSPQLEPLDRRERH